MLVYIARRLLLMIPTLAIISMISFWIINLPPGNYVDSFMAQMAGQGQIPDFDTRQQLEQLYGVNRPLYVQYWKWISRALTGDFGQSFEWRRPVSDLIGDRLGRTIAISLASTAWWRPSDQRRPYIRRPVNSSTMTTSPSLTTYCWSRE